MSRGNLSDSRRERLKAASPVKVGDVVADKYRVEELIAAGGMGVVVKARHEILGQIVAIKFLIPAVLEDESAARFLREAKAAARIQSERVVRVFDCGSLPSGVPYMVMEHLEGVELAQVIREGGPMPVAEAVDLIASALEGVAEAHALRIVHRDLKPTNLFLLGGAQRPYAVKVLDFGISKIQPGPQTPIDDELTGSAMLLGSPRYISPEQARSSSHVDVRADLWSVGVILYELLDGKCPFAGDTIGEVLSKILVYTPKPLQTQRDDVPEGLAQVIDRCLRRDRRERFANAAELAYALAPFGTDHARIHAERIGVILGVKPPGEPLEAEDETDRPDDTRESAAEQGATPTAGQPSDQGADESPDISSVPPSLPTVVTPAKPARLLSEPGAETEPSGPGLRTESTWAHTGPRERGHRARMVLLVVVPALVLGALAAWFWLRGAPSLGSAATTETGSTSAGSDTATVTAAAIEKTAAAVSPATDGDASRSLTADAGAVDAAVSAQPSASRTRPPSTRSWRPPPSKRPGVGSDSILDQSD